MAVKKDVKPTLTCNLCDRTIQIERNFYSSENKKYKSIGVIPICKECVKSYFTDAFKKTRDVQKAIIATCVYLDMPFNERNISEYENNGKISTEDALATFYKFVTTNSGIGSKLHDRKDFDIVGLVMKAYTPISESENTLTEDDKLYLVTNKYDIEIDDDVIMFFGEGYSEKQYQILLREYLKLSRSYSVGTIADELLFKEIAYLNLKIGEAKQNGTSEKEIISLIDARRKLLIDTKIQTKKDTSEAIQGLGALIRKMEFTRPASDPLPEWDDNKLHELEVLIAGHLMASNDITNALTDEYDELVKEYGVEDFVNEVSEEE